ncbi:MAG: hypothetical protein KDD50_01425 [Bdellovibrionales bacterium]|nr:hypothetical protein [Bdellovibrionales bacterium]
MAKKSLFGILVLSVLITMFQNCAGGIGSEDSSSQDGADVSKSDTDLSLSIENPFQIDLNNPVVTLPSNDMDESGEDNTNVLGPDVLSQTDVTVRAPDNCESQCQSANDCSTKAGTQKTMCQNMCSRDQGICKDQTISRDPNTISNITIPAGYKKARISIEFCSDRNDVMIFGGPNVSFKTTHKSGRDPYWFWWWDSSDFGWWNWWGWNTHYVGQEVGRGNWCMYRKRNSRAWFWWYGRGKKGDYNDTAYVSVRSTNSNGQLQAAKEYRWAMPGFLPFNFGKVVSDMDSGKAAYAIVKKINGRGVKRYAYYNNQSEIGQVETVLEFDVWYYNWWNSIYTVEIDFYYKKRLELTQFQN